MTNAAVPGLCAFWKAPTVVGKSRDCASPVTNASPAESTAIPEQKSLLAANHTLDEMRDYIGVTSLAFLSVDGLYRAVGYDKRDPIRPQFTDHCFTGDYPTHLTDIVGESAKQQLSLLAEAG